MTAPQVITVIHEGSSERLDRIVTNCIEPGLGFSRSQVEKWIEAGCVTVDGKVVTRPGVRVNGGIEVRVTLPPVISSELAAYEHALDIIFEDEHLLVINKPCGLSMHPGAGNRTETLANAVVAHVGRNQLQVGESDRPGIVHRLDKDTTGLVVVAKSTPLHAAIAKQFAERTVARAYIALVYTTPRAVRAVQQSESGEVNAAIGRHPTDRKRMALVEGGKSAVTRWKVLERMSYGTLLECTLATGRTHQIRVHMNSIGCPVIGDPTYGDFSNIPRGLREAATVFGRQALHAATLSFTHPITGSRLNFTCEPPLDFSQLMTAFRLGDRA